MDYLFSGGSVLHGIYILYILYIIASVLFCFITIKQDKKIKRICAEHKIALARQSDQQRRVLKGKISEELFPLMAGCPYLPADMKFFGSPIDYVILDGYSEAKDDGGEFREVIFADVKTGKAVLSAHQKKIKQAIQAGRVRWETIRIRDDGTIVFERD